ncbi:ribonuclease R [Syntrophomonas erecta]
MINRNELLDFMHQESYRPLAYHELMAALGVDPVEEDKFCKTLGRLEKEGEIVKTRKNKYGLPEMMNLTRGIIRLSQRGYGILLPDEPGYPEIFVYGKKLNGAMHSDRVMVRIHQKAHNDQRPEGEVVRVISRANKELVGTYEKVKNLVQVIPDDSRQIYPIYVKPTKKLKVSNGDKVVVKITAWPDKNRSPEGRIIEVLGKKGQPGLDIEVVIKKHGLRVHFPEAVLDEAREVAINPSQEEINCRRDLRAIKMVTIDGEDAKDLDDAVSIERTEGGYLLGVHIADVSHYVKEGGKLDKEACARGTSVYLVDKVLPMLPPQLSNDVCSLNARVDRLAISCMMEINQQGRVLDYDIFKSVINIDERMTYTAVNKILVENDAATCERYKELVEDFRLMKELADILRQDRSCRGALDFDFPESKVIVDDKGFPVEIKRFERGPGEMLIEDFMIKANEVIAEHLYWQEMPILYRVHEKPDEESLNKLNLVLGVFGHRIRENKVEPSVFQKVLMDIKGRPEEQLIALVMLRSMKHARYMPQALGHFGLASKFYCHFTSPIRRYPDLIVHRVLSAILEGSMNARKRSRWKRKMTSFGEQATVQEMKAEEAERELVDIKKAQYMHQFVGAIFEARISSIQSFGFFVELDNTVEGLVHISSIVDDYYQFNDRNYTLVGNHTSRRFSIGDPVKVQLVRVNVDDAKIDFELV